MKNIVFDIQRFCVNDGPGIRTTVFLKGCRLNCLWCHNPESKSHKPVLMFHQSKCIGCMRCSSVCNLHSFTEDVSHLIDRKNCILCGKCVNECCGALEICGKEMSAEEVIKVVLKDKDFYLNSNGGLTISGGDPLANVKFTKEILIEAKKHNLHTAIETSGYATWEEILEIIPYVDMFLWDFKESSSELHKKFTGVGNEVIINNLIKLNEYGKGIILRCPIIPGFNDRDEHLKEIGLFAERLCSVIGVEVEPYHSLGKSKSEEIGVNYPLENIALSSEEIVFGWISVISHYTHKKVKKA